MEIKINGKSYQVVNAGTLYLSPLSKFVLALYPESQVALTDEINKAASSALRKFVPDIEPEIASILGINNLDIAEIARIVTELSEMVIQPTNGNGFIDITAINEKDEKIKQLESELKRVRDKAS